MAGLKTSRGSRVMILDRMSPFLLSENRSEVGSGGWVAGIAHCQTVPSSLQG